MKTAPGKLSVATIPKSELISKKAIERGALRSGEVQRKVKDAMKVIEKEMAQNEGIYPHNKAAFSAAELARRAGIHPTTLHSPKQKEFGKEVKAWIEALKQKGKVGRGSARRAQAERLSEWRLLYEGLAQSHRDTELLLQATEAELERLRSKLDLISKENAALRQVLGDGNVVPFLTRDS